MSAHLMLTVFEPNDGDDDKDATFSRLSADSVQFPPRQLDVERTNPSSGTITIGRTVDGSSAQIHAAAVRGDYFKRAVVLYYSDGKKYNQTIEISDGSFVEYQLSPPATPGQDPTELVTLGFSNWKFETQAMNMSPSDSGSPVRVGWDLKSPNQPI